ARVGTAARRGGEPPAGTASRGGRAPPPGAPEPPDAGRPGGPPPPVAKDAAAQGTEMIALEAADSIGRIAIATSSITFDFDCPRFVELAVEPAAVAPGARVAVRIVASETLGAPPLVSRGGAIWEMPTAG